MKPKLLVLVYLSEEHRALVAEQFDMVYAPIEKPRVDRSEAAVLIAKQGGNFRVVLTNGATGLTPDEFAGLSALEIVCSLGVGYEHIPVDVATARGIRVCNAAGTNDAAVADHAMAILLAAIRRIPFLNTGVRNGLWRDDIPRPPHVSGRKLGIFGLGAIGRQMARRALGFDMAIGYCSRRRRDESGYQWFDDIHALATWCDYLVICAPAGADTHHIVNARVLNALGPDGVLVNVARGSLVDTAALADALREKRISAAALDVYEGEPLPPASLLEFDNAILTPHIAGISPQAIHASVVRFIDNATRHFAGQPLLTPVN